MTKPVVGVTGPSVGGTAAWWFTRLALLRSGAQAVRITPGKPVDVERLNGIIVGGGADVSESSEQFIDLDGWQALAGETLAHWRNPDGQRKNETGPSETRRRSARRRDILIAPLIAAIRLAAGKREQGIDQARDALEFELLRHAEQRQLPVLGICRGAQLMNLALGGSLVRHVGQFYAERPSLYTVLPRRHVQLEPDSALRAIVGTELLAVNSLHQHAIARPGTGLRVVAREKDGIVQAVERTDGVLWLGVQWHPEYLPQSQRHARLFEHLVLLCHQAMR